MTHTICENQRITEDGLIGWRLTLVATPGVGTWNIKATLTRNSRVKEQHGRWSARTGWTETMWHPLPGSLIAKVAEDWMRAHPVPISDGVVVRRGRP
jgi:hypothetical protein